MSSKRQKNKGWILPDPITGYDLIDVCLKIPDEQRYRAAFWGTVWELGKWWNWEKTYTPGDTRAKEAAEYWRELLITYMVLDCEVGNVYALRQNEENPCLLEQSIDGGVTWTPAFDFEQCPGGGISVATQITLNNQLIIATYIENYNGTPSSVNENAPDDYFSDGTNYREIALCMALDAYITSYLEEWRRRAEWTLFGAIAALFLAMIPGIGWVAVVIGAGAYIFTMTALNAVKDRDAVQDVICCAYDALLDQTINTTIWEACLNNCSFTPGSNQAIVRDIVASDLNELGNWTAFCDALGRAYVLAQAGVDTCVCTDTSWTLDLLGGDGNTWCEPVSYISDGTPTPVPTYDAVNDRYLAGIHGAARTGMVKIEPGVPFTITEVSMTYSLDFTAANSRSQVILQDYWLTTIWSALVSKNENADITRTITKTGLYQQVSDLSFRWSSATNTSPYARLTKIQIKGVGVNPFV